jgi:hypothetical protein
MSIKTTMANGDRSWTGPSSDYFYDEVRIPGFCLDDDPSYAVDTKDRPEHSGVYKEAHRHNRLSDKGSQAHLSVHENRKNVESSGLDSQILLKSLESQLDLLLQYECRREIAADHTLRLVLFVLTLMTGVGLGVILAPIIT